ncbi:MAG: inorganic diphosphatase [Ardenticatenales bacterium]|nr:inorganic diphosphatase [Ardenticatenales bacterium]
MRPDLTTYLGKTVTVTVDRPLGSTHPRYADLIAYPINYGYLPNTISGDGQPIDVYILGVEQAVEQFSGVIIAVVLREDDVEDKLVAAPAGRCYTAAEIVSALSFQEQFFSSRVGLETKP